MSTPFSVYVADAAVLVTNHLEGLLVEAPDHWEKARPKQLIAAMRHGVLNGGKRLRPFLVLETAGLFGLSPQEAMSAAASLECVHCYSLIHDDLPAMDDDDLRRGQPTVHKAFDEATAILAGDALLTFAFDLLAQHHTHADPLVRSELVLRLARAAGMGGMIGGQMLDIGAERETPNADTVRTLQAMKTGALIRYACEAGSILGGATVSERQSLSRYGEIIGLAFQLADDLLDETSTPEAMGKAVGKDADQGKATLVSLHGADAVRAELAALVAEAEACLATFGDRGDRLRETAQFVAQRTS
ncbi:MAG: polyprenyl synthetase family protein [Pseudomonadota bacterium]